MIGGCRLARQVLRERINSAANGSDLMIDACGIRACTLLGNRLTQGRHFAYKAVDCFG